MPGAREQRETPPLVSDRELDQILAGDANALVQVAERLGQDFANGLSTSQIRNVFGEVKRLQMKGFNEQTARELILLKPKLAYQAGRHDRTKVPQLANILSKAIDRVGSDQRRFENFVDFFEAILAYHKAYGGK